MRRFLAFFLLFILASPQATGASISDGDFGFVQGTEGSIEYGGNVPGSVQAPVKTGTPAKTGRPVATAPPVCQSQLYFADGSCVNLGDSWVPTPGVNLNGPAAVPVASRPEIVAAIEYFRTHHLPVPNPVLSTPQGITGAVHSIDLRMPATETYSDPATPLGELTLAATGRFTVDWGDGTTDTYTVTGAPYPNSPLTHTWTRRGTYEVTVTADWSVTWSYAGETGTITGLRTTSTIPDFQVIQLQAVVVAN